MSGQIARQVDWSSGQPAPIRRRHAFCLKRAFCSKLASSAVSLAPGKARHGGAEGVVLAADPAGIAALVDAPEDEIPADFSGAGLVAAGNVGELHVVDDGHQRLETLGHVTLGDLAVV